MNMFFRHTLVLLALFLAACFAPAPTDAELSLPSPAGAVAPRLSPTAAGGVLLSWIVKERDTDDTAKLQFSRHDGSDWSEPQTVVEGDDWFVNWADTAGVTALDNGLLVAHWLQKNGESTYAYEVRYRVSANNGASWSEPQRAHDDASASEHGFVSVVARDDGFEMAWLDGRNTLSDDGGMTLRLGRYAADGSRLLERELDGLTCDCCPTDAIRHGSDTLVVYRDRDAEERRDIFMAKVDADANVQLSEVNNDGWIMPACPVNGPSIATEGETLHVAWFTAVNGEREIRHATADAAGQFSTVQLLAEGDPQGRVGLLSLHDGRVLAMWLAGRGNNGRIELQVLNSETRHVIPDLSTTRALGYPQLGQLRNDDVLLVWTNPDGGGLVGRRITL